MGEIEPLSDTSVTSGICEDCMVIEMAIIEEYHAHIKGGKNERSGKNRAF